MFTFLIKSLFCYKVSDVAGVPGGSVVKNPPLNAGDSCLIPESGRSLESGNGNPLQDSCRRTPWTEEPGGLQSTGSPRVRQGFVIKHSRLRKCELSVIFLPQSDSSFTVFSSYSSEFGVVGISQVL